MAEIKDSKLEVEVKLDEKFQEKFDALNTELETVKADAKKKADEMTAKLDAIEAKNKELNDELAKWKNPESDEVKQMLDAKQKVVDMAKQFKIDCEGKSTAELKLECIKKTDCAGI